MERKLIELYREMHDNGTYFFNKHLPFFDEEQKSTILEMDGDYAVFLDAERIESIAEETEIVGHECGHAATGTTHSVCSPLDLVEKHEYKANKWAVHRLLPLEEIRSAIRGGYVEPWEVAEHTGRTEKFVRMALDIYRAEGRDLYAEFSQELFSALLVS